MLGAERASAQTWRWGSCSRGSCLCDGTRIPADNPFVPECDWRVTSVAGSCREQLRRWRSLSTAYSLITSNPLCSIKDLSEAPPVSGGEDCRRGGLGDEHSGRIERGHCPASDLAWCIRLMGQRGGCAEVCFPWVHPTHPMSVKIRLSASDSYAYPPP